MSQAFPCLAVASDIIAGDAIKHLPLVYRAPVVLHGRAHDDEAPSEMLAAMAVVKTIRCAGFMMDLLRD